LCDVILYEFLGSFNIILFKCLFEIFFYILRSFEGEKKPMESILFGKCNIFFFLIVAKKNYGNDSILFFAFFDSTLKINFVRKKFLELSKGSKIFIFLSFRILEKKHFFYQTIFNVFVTSNVTWFNTWDQCWTEENHSFVPNHSWSYQCPAVV
jgi:hypothetical protein